jgi:hypothetical protein
VVGGPEKGVLWRIRSLRRDYFLWSFRCWRRGVLWRFRGWRREWFSLVAGVRGAEMRVFWRF